MTIRRLAAIAALLLVPGVARAHTALVRAEPALKSVLKACPTRVYLVFSEPLEPAMASIGVNGVKLASSGDPHDVHAVLAPFTCPGPGTYSVSWHVVSADGHAVDGKYMFTVEGETPSVGPVTVPLMTPPPPAEVRDPMIDAKEDSSTPLIASFLRGAALATLMALAGLLFFRVGGMSSKARPAELTLAVMAPLLLAAHLAAWAMNSDVAHRLTTTPLFTRPGQMELWRVGLAVFALWALALARRPRLGMLFAFMALAVSGALGHPAAIHPEGTIAAKALHLMAGAVWLGGLLHLMTIPRGESALFVRQASRVSNLALGAVIVVVLSGVIQWRYFLPTFALVDSTYGVLLLAKIVGLVALLAFGAYHRYRVIPRLTQAHRFGASLRVEVVVMILVALVGALLSYTSPPVSP